MISRMILVGLVAVLGVSLPSRPESGGWLTSAHAWAIAQLAEWDACTPGEDRGFIVTETPSSSPREATQTATRTNTPTSVAFDPIPVDNDLDTGLADELNGMAEGLDIPVSSTAIVESPRDFVAVPPGDSIELKLVVELCRIAGNSTRDEPVSSPAIPRPREADAAPAIDEVFSDVSNVFAPPEPGPASIAQQPREAGSVPAIDEIFADVSNVFAPPEPERASTTQPKPGLTVVGPDFEPIQSLVDLAVDSAAKWNRFVEGIKIRPEDEAFQARPARTQTFEPIEVPADLESEVAYELNRESEGLDIVPPEVQSLGDSRRPIPESEPDAHPEGNRNHGDASIEKALGLTRDAAFAWMNVLTGMTPVSMTSQ